MKEFQAEVLKAVKKLVSSGLVARTWGNVSCRVDDRKFIITPSGMGYDNLDESNLVLCDATTLDYEGDITPSSEKKMHARIYLQDPEIKFIIHTHQTYATCISVSGHTKLDPTKKEIEQLGGEIGFAGYGISGTSKLAKNVVSQIALGSKAVLMANHGALLVGENSTETFERSAALENVCKRAMNGVPDFDASPSLIDENADQIISLINDGYPAYKSIMLLASKAIVSAMERTNKLPAMIDDFGQMIGSDVKVITYLESDNVKKKMRNRNAVCVRGIGAFCCAESESDTLAMLTLMEKNSLSFLNSLNNGEMSKLPYLSRKLMRYEYIKKYSKLK